MERGLLTICIPTYNRANKLDYSLSRFEKELANVDTSLLEFFISDNCSPDNTGEIVSKYIEKGLPIVYSRNEENIGPDNNFLKCFYAAKSKYLWLLGDDDYLLEGKLKVILDILQRNSIGCLNLKNSLKYPHGTYSFIDNQKFLSLVGHWMTFMSGNIIRTQSIPETYVTEKLRRSNLLQMPFFIDSALKYSNNIILKEDVFENSLDDSNGGYNFFKVFVKNYLDIWKSYRKNRKIKWSTFWTIKRRLLWYFVLPFIVNLYILKKYPNLQKKNGWKILLKYYGLEFYFYFYILKIPYILYKNRRM